MTRAATSSPYKGLSPFEDSDHDAALFFGREREQRIITANLTAARLTLLYGASGVGKSSVLRAAVVRRLRELPGPLAVVVFDDWREDPGARLREAVAAAAGNRPEGSLADTLDAASARFGGELYVILDGAEEYFVYHARESEPGTFAADFPDAVVRADLRANFLLALREDSLAALDPFKARIPSLFANSLRLDHLDREAARAAIVGPLEELNRIERGYRYAIEPELVEAVLAQVARGKVDLRRTGRGVANGAKSAAAGYVETPYLSLVMERLWEAEREQGSEVLRLRTLEELGGAEQIVRDHLDDALAALSPSGQEAAAEMFTHLVTPSGTKIAHRVSDLEQYAGVGSGSLEPTLHTLTSERILRPVADANGSMRYEIFHDVLADAVLAWRAAYATQQEVERERSSSRRRMRRVLVAGAVAFVLLIAMAGVAIFALAQRSDAQHQRNLRALEGRQASALAFSVGALSQQLDGDPQTSLLLAVNAARQEPTPAVASVLRQALTASHVRAVVRGGGSSVHVAFAPGGRLIAVGGGNGSVRIVGLNGKTVRVLRRHGGPVTAVAFDREGTRLLSAGTDGTAQIWRLRDGKVLHGLDGGGQISSASFSPGGGRVLTVAGRTARIWLAATGARLATLEGHERRITSASFSRDGTRVVTTSLDKTARVWNAWTGGLLYVLARSKLGLTAAAWGPGDMLVTGSADHNARIWRRDVSVRALHQSTPVTAVAVSPKGDRIVAAGTKGSAFIWKAGTGTLWSLWFALRGHASAITSASFSPDGAWIVTTSRDRTARVWKADTGSLWSTLRGHRRPVTDASFSPNGFSVVTASDDGTARVWDPNTRPLLAPIEKTGGRVNSVAFSRDGIVLAAASSDGTARIWRKAGATWTRVAKLDHGGHVTDVAFSPDGRSVVTASTDGTARVWSRSGKLLRVLHHDAAVRTASFSGDGTRIVSGSDDGTAKIWQLDTGGPPLVLRHGAPVLVASFSPDGKLVLTAGTDHLARLWRVDGTFVRTLRGHAGPIVDASFSHNGSKIVTASTDHTGRIWSVRTGRPLHVLVGHERALTSAAFSPDDRSVVTASRDGLPRVWSVASGRTTAVLEGHPAAVNDAVFSPDGRWVATAGPKAGGLFGRVSGAPELFLFGSERPLTTIEFSPDGKWIAAGGLDGFVRAYRCDICGNLRALVALAQHRLDATGRKLTRAERALYLG